jgi:hypothetical protein
MLFNGILIFLNSEGLRRMDSDRDSDFKPIHTFGFPWIILVVFCPIDAKRSLTLIFGFKVCYFSGKRIQPHLFPKAP